ncbi:zinc-binding dehydrogenase [Aestuariicella hydrocarbonica]|uniref:Zinc-binding dehydrogenase n=1 Tax=Pseudomaricurvus hydrocarbonicus TaxID=1470433 RepID=A0A9E5JW92_9GAMM|nr:zinc-binding dehydrogenase [Aestuariicella hydrocarbonica]NHO65726.1 zinc-binding dehydrogenase [Aestuariicella hydrocarbonica]
MKAAYILDGQVSVGEVPDPIPQQGQVLVRTHSCGLCASEAHFLQSGEQVVGLCQKHGGPYAGLDLSRPFVPGHEYVGEVIDYGPNSKKPIRIGRKVTSVPIMRQAGAHSVIGFNNDCPGGFGEYMLLDEDMVIEVPSGLDDDLAAMTEPLAVGLEHARRGLPTNEDTPLVIGCGAIGLGVIVGLKLKGIGPIVAADFHAGRRKAALKMGADIVIDPREMSPYEPIHDLGGRQVNLVYECAGVPGLLQQIIQSVRFDGRIVMGGYCMEPEQILTFSAQNKRLTVYFAGGEEPQDMTLALNTIADGKIDIGSWIGAKIGLGGIAQALAEMSGPEAAIRTVVDPRKF